MPDGTPVVYCDDAPDEDGLVDAGMGFALVVAWVPDERGGSLVAAAESGFRGWRARPSADVDALAQVARTRVEAALGFGVHELRARHVRAHRALWERCKLDLSASAASNPHAEKAELYLDLGHYLLVAGSRRGTQPHTLQGIWNAEVRPAWSSNLITNINTPMNHWGAEATGLGEMHEPLHPIEGWPGGAVFQIDGNVGAVAGIAELVVQSHHEVVTILPALPAGWPSGNARGLRVRGGDAVDLEPSRHWAPAPSARWTHLPRHILSII